jgi:predicted kinase
MQATERSGAGIGQGLYSSAANETTYRHLGDIAEASLSAGISIVIDAAFLDRHERDRFRRLAQKLGAGFVILDITAPTEVLRDRITARSRGDDDASDADLAVLDHQRGTADAIGDDELELVVTVATERTVDTSRLADTIRARTDQVSLSSTSS